MPSGPVVPDPRLVPEPRPYLDCSYADVLFEPPDCPADPEMPLPMADPPEPDPPLPDPFMF